MQPGGGGKQVRIPPARPTSCTPTGKPLPGENPGNVMQGTPRVVQMRLHSGEPVQPRPSGASPGAAGVMRTSTPSKTLSKAARAASRISSAQR